MKAGDSWPRSGSGRWKSLKKRSKKTSDNIFLDLGFEPAEAAVLQMRANLMNDLRLYIEAERLTQAEAAKRLGIAQSRVSDLVRGKWEKFSLEMLVMLEARLGVRLEWSWPLSLTDKIHASCKEKARWQTVRIALCAIFLLSDSVVSHWLTTGTGLGSFLASKSKTH